MRISDWSSDVCSSDLTSPLQPPPAGSRRLRRPRPGVDRQPHLRLAALGVDAVGQLQWRPGVAGVLPGPAQIIDGPAVLLDPGQVAVAGELQPRRAERSEEHTSELQSLMRISYAVFCLKKKNTN